jgi:hypothetical protein
VVGGGHGGWCRRGGQGRRDRRGARDGHLGAQVAEVALKVGDRALERREAVGVLGNGHAE